MLLWFCFILGCGAVMDGASTTVDGTHPEEDGTGEGRDGAHATHTHASFLFTARRNRRSCTLAPVD